MAATGLQMNWSAVGYTPSGGSLTSLVKITGVDFDTGGELIDFSGDTDRFPTTVVNSMNRPSATVRSGNPGQLMTLVPGTVGAFTATHKDAKLASGGDIVYTLANAVVGSPSASGEHAQFGTTSLQFKSYSSDGATNPLAFTRV